MLATQTIVIEILQPCANADNQPNCHTLTAPTRKISEEKYAYGVVNQPMGDSFAPSACTSYEDKWE